MGLWAVNSYPPVFIHQDSIQPQLGLLQSKQVLETFYQALLFYSPTYSTYYCQDKLNDFSDVQFYVVLI